MKLDINGESLNYVREGSGPAVLFIHFLGGFSGSWRRQFDALKDRYTCAAFDTRGFGFSTYNGRWDADTGAKDLKAGLDALGIDRAHVVGFSMGGPVALTFNTRWPEMVRSLTLIDTFAKNHTHSKDRLAESDKCFRYMSMREYARQYAATRLLPSTPLAAFDELVSSMSLASKRAYMDVLRGILIPDFTEHCSKVKVPTLVLCGEFDRTTPPSFTSDLTNLISGAVERVIPTGHLPCFDDPAVLTQALAQFLDAQPR
jgi:pimeloyl-ACP methyl ester carboxylesterase